MRFFQGGVGKIIAPKFFRGNFHARFRRCRSPFCSKSLNSEISQNGHLPLTMIAPGESVKLVEITAGRCLRHRLTELGLTPGVELKIMQNESGPLLLAVHDTRLALGRCMAHSIIVQYKGE